MQTDEYRKLAAVEDRMWYFRGLHGQIAQEAQRALAEGGPPPRILDAGCGTGGLMLALRPRLPAAEWAGLDFSPLACAFARERTGCPIEQGSVAELPYADETFDVVISADVICQIDEPGRALAEFRRVLRPGGRVIINVPALRWLWSYHDDSCETKHRFRRSELEGLLRKAGLQPEFVTYRNVTVFPLIAARRKLLPAPTGTSDMRLYPAPAEALLRGLMTLERLWLRQRWRQPIGTSVFAVARKPALVPARA